MIRRSEWGHRRSIRRLVWIHTEMRQDEAFDTGWSDAMVNMKRRSGRRFIQCPSHVTYPLRFSDTTAPTLCTDGVSDHPVLKTPHPSLLCLLPLDCRIDRRFILTKVSDHPVLKASSWRVSIWIQTERRIDRLCPHSDRRIIRCYCLCCSSSATRPTLLNNGPSVHPTVPRVSPCVPTRPTIATTLVKLMSSVHPTVSFLFLFLLGFDPLFWHFGMMFSFILRT
jgi:hypothetical protein